MKKRIVFVAPEFYTFHRQIHERLEELGNTVYFIPDRPSQKTIIKILVRKFRFLLGPYLFRFFKKKAEQIPGGDIEEVFIIRGEGLTVRSLGVLRAHFPRARFQLYLWDSIKRSPGCQKLIPHMDRTWTYDLRDAKNYPGLRFTPNFYTLPKARTFNHAPVDDFKWDLVFFGTTHADRLAVVKRLDQNLPAGTRFFRFFYFQSPILYYFRKYFDRAFAYFKPEELGLKPKFGKEWNEIVSRASTILDVHHPDQGGLTIRLLESLALGFKIATTDFRIREYAFFNPEQIIVLDRKDPHIPLEFLRRPNDFPVHAQIESLELTDWLQKIFGGERD